MLSALVATMSGQSRSFHDHSTVMIASAESPGFASGSMIFQKIWNWFAPSRRAASSSSGGSPMKNWRIMNVPKALKMPGAAMPMTVFSQPSPWMIWYCGSR